MENFYVVKKRLSVCRLEMIAKKRISSVVLACRHDLSEDDFVEFSKNVQDRIIGTKDGVAHVCHSFCLLLHWLNE